MNREAQSVLWLVAIISLILFVLLTWVCVIYDAVHEADRINSVVQGIRSEET